MKKKILWYIIIIVSICGCVSTRTLDNSDFFFWMESYIAVPVDSTFQIALTYYYDDKENHLDVNNISSMEFLDISKHVNIQEYSINQMDFGDDNKYMGYSFGLDLKFIDKGNYKTEFVKFNFYDGSEVIYPIGKYFFDIDEPETTNPVIDTWSSPAASSDDTFLAYAYKCNDLNAVIKEIKYGELSIDSAEGIALENKIKLENYNSPVKFIKTKIKVKLNDNYTTVYGKGCYCGALNIDKNDIVRSLEYSNKKFKELN